MISLPCSVDHLSQQTDHWEDRICSVKNLDNLCWYNGIMPRKPRPCTQCGKPMQVSRYTAAEPMHNACRRAARRAECSGCGRPFEKVHHYNRFCSRSCAFRHRDVGPCTDCGITEGVTGVPTPLCDQCRSVRADALKIRRAEAARQYRIDHPEFDVAKARRRRATKRGLPAEPYTLAEIAERDGYRCGWCGLLVDMALSGLEPKGPTIDHVIPISRGGPDTPGNVQLMHRECNLIKGATMPDQGA